jgi:hypothetical protein
MTTLRHVIPHCSQPPAVVSNGEKNALDSDIFCKFKAELRINKMTLKHSHRILRKDRTSIPPAFFCFSAYAQLAHLALPHAQIFPSQNQKSQFLADPRLRTITF